MKGFESYPMLVANAIEPTPRLRKPTMFIFNFLEILTSWPVKPSSKNHQSVIKFEN